jgi:hypothetical protein
MTSRRILIFFISVTLGALFVIWPVGAVSITSSPDRITPGDRVIVDIADLADDASFSILIEGHLPVRPDGSFSLSVEEFALPISLREGEMAAYSESTVWTGLSVRKGGTTVSASGDSQNGVFQTSEKRDVGEGVYDYLRVEGSAVPGASMVIARMQLTGKKEGPEDSRISFTVGGVESGTIQVRIDVEGTEVMNKVVSVVPSASPGGGGAGYVPPAESPAGTVTTLPTAPATEMGDHWASDGLVCLHTDDAALNISGAEAGPAPKGWKLVSLPYQVTPLNYSLTAPASLRFNLPDRVEGPVFLSVWEGGAWRILPSRVEGSGITAEIFGTGIYGLMTLDDQPSPEEDEVLTAASVSPVGTPTAAPALLTVAAIAALAIAGIRRVGR